MKSGKRVISDDAMKELESYTLTTKQEEFAQLYVEFRSARAAYTTAYKPSDIKSYGSITKAAQALLEHPAIRKRISEIRRPMIERARCSMEEHLYELSVIRDAAIAGGAWNAAVAAEVARGKVLGYYDKNFVSDELPEPSKVELVIEDASVVNSNVVNSNPMIENAYVVSGINQ